ncbi:NAD(P)-dependent oxidoreductase [Rhodococcus opacus]|uniref:NAD(P)-dependent oxidoreductase n=1 Tax=Rhodococcus opacus TaxID=37919 RepID=UPI000EA8AB02|nr:NAD(P)-dependent oxidoreductase [Rhodococcus opacus]QZS52769.1 NAD(P)-dependent oxidoreductase [Rhodococcus opacus]RKM65232.1 2-hydroxy-3-oxopropionate reductase [Rhodococcus opacus]
MSSKRTLGFVGLGVMGGPMSINLVTRSGHEMIAFDLSTDSLDRVVDAGAKRGASVVDVAEQADVVFLSLPSIAEVEAVAEELLSATNPPKIIVDMSTSDVTRTRALGALLARDGVELVDAPVARLRQAAKDGTLLITVGATPERFTDLQPLLSCMGSDIVHAGSLGSGQVIKILNNMVVFQTVNALAEARAIGTAAGVDPKLLFETLTLGSADSFVLRKSALATLAVDEFPVKTFPTVYAIKDLNLALQLARDEGVPTASADQTMTLLEATRDAGYSDEYYPVMVKLIEGGTRK